MLSGTRRFDLYDFFSVLLPGTAFLLGLVPYLPQDSNPTSLGVVFPLLAAGFIVGRSIHSAAVIIEKRHKEPAPNAGMIRTGVIYPVMGIIFAHDWENDISHRRRFVNELTSPDNMEEELVEAYFKSCARIFEDLELPDERAKVGEECAETLYDVTRSYIHIDGRGRSRTFQAVYAFYRSMWLVSLMLAVAYMSYGIIDLTNVNSGTISYTSLVGSLGIPGWIISLGGFALAVAGYYTFSSAKRDYQEYYVEYLFADFVVLQNNEEDVRTALQEILVQ